MRADIRPSDRERLVLPGRTPRARKGGAVWRFSRGRGLRTARGLCSGVRNASTVRTLGSSGRQSLVLANWATRTRVGGANWCFGCGCRLRGADWNARAVGAFGPCRGDRQGLTCRTRRTGIGRAVGCFGGGRGLSSTRGLCNAVGNASTMRALGSSGRQSLVLANWATRTRVGGAGWCFGCGCDCGCRLRDANWNARAVRALGPCRCDGQGLTCRTGRAGVGWARSC